jgi:uncharacterized membrane protein
MSGRRWLVVGLTTSVVVNLLLVGFLVGRVSGMPHPSTFRANTQASIGWMMRHLPDERRDVLRPEARAHFGELRPALRKLRQAQRRLFEVLIAEELDQDALNGVIVEMREGIDTTLGHNLEFLAQLAGKLTVEERRMLAEGLRRPHERSPGRRRPRSERQPQ